MIKQKFQSISHSLDKLSVAKIEMFHFHLKGKSYPASGWQRFGCWFLDCLLSFLTLGIFMMGCFLVVMLTTGKDLYKEDNPPFIVVFLGTFIFMFFRPLCMILFKQTPTQIFLQIYTTNCDLGPISFRQNLIRHACSIYVWFVSVMISLPYLVFGEDLGGLEVPRELERVILFGLLFSLLGVGCLWIIGSLIGLKNGKTIFDRWSKTQTLKKSTDLELETQRLQDQILTQERKLRLILEEEMAEARQMQISLLPESAPAIEGLDVSGRSIAAKEVGGDFFDYFERKEKLLIAVGDVSGKGLKAAMNAVMASGILNLSSEYQDQVHLIMSDVNDNLCRGFERGTNATAIIAEFDSKNKQMVLANAGQHALPILKRNSSLTPILAKGFPLGMKTSISYEPITVQFQSGDLLLLMTDGITEPRNAEGLMYEESGRFHQVIAKLSDELTADQVVETIIEDVIEYMVDEERADDITLVAIKVT